MYNTMDNLASQYGSFIGIDWADEKHDFCIYRDQKMDSFEIKNNRKVLTDYFESLLKEAHGKKIAVIIEKSTLMITYLLDEMDLVDVYKIHPTTAALYRRTFTPSEAKSDPSDAESLLDLWFRHRDKMDLSQTDEEAEALNYLTLKRRKLVDSRTALTNELTATLKVFYSGILEVLDGALHAPINIGFLKKWPSPNELQDTSNANIRYYFKKRSTAKHKLTNRMKIIKDIHPVVLNSFKEKAYRLEIIDLVSRIMVLNESIKSYEIEINVMYKDNEQHQIFDSFPGAGAALGPRLMAFFGNNPEKLPKVDDALQISEIAPVLIQSGKSRYVRRRYLANRFIQQTFVEFADGSLKKSIWAQEYYKKKKVIGKKHYTILRSLAFKWIRILHKCWRDQIPYCEEIHMKNLEKYKPKNNIKTGGKKTLEKSENAT